MSLKAVFCYSRYSGIITGNIYRMPLYRLNQQGWYYLGFTFPRNKRTRGLVDQ